jgi:cytochrome c553
MKSLNWSRYAPVLPAAVLLIVPSAWAEQHPGGAPAIVTWTCSGCHGVDGNSQLSYIPRLAGLNAAYVERKLTSFRAAASPPVDEALSRVVSMGRASTDAGITPAANVHMVGVARAVSGEDGKAAAQWYASRMPARGKSGKPKLIEEGRSLFNNGLQSQGLLACQICHGSEAQGSALAPRLAGQNAAYVVSQLALFRATDRQQSSQMTVVAQHLERDQARAVAAYLQSR